MPSTSDLLADWRAKEQAATEGPWKAEPHDDYLAAIVTDDTPMEYVTGGFNGIEEPDLRSEDAAFIADARTAVPALLSAVEAVLALCDSVDVETNEAQQGWLVDVIREAVSAALGTEEESNG